MRVQILGPSCTTSLKLEMLVRQTLAELGMRDARVERLTAPRQELRPLWGEPPWLIIDGQLVWSGGKDLPTKDVLRRRVRETILMPV